MKEQKTSFCPKNHPGLVKVRLYFTVFVVSCCVYPLSLYPPLIFSHLPCKEMTKLTSHQVSYQWSEMKYCSNYFQGSVTKTLLRCNHVFLQCKTCIQALVRSPITKTTRPCDQKVKKNKTAGCRLKIVMPPELPSPPLQDSKLSRASTSQWILW